MYDKCQIISSSHFINNIERIFSKEYNFVADYELAPSHNYQKEISGFLSENGASQLMNYFVSHYYFATKWPDVIALDRVINAERVFLEHFRTVLKNFI